MSEEVNIHPISAKQESEWVQLEQSINIKLDHAENLILELKAKIGYVLQHGETDDEQGKMPSNVEARTPLLDALSALEYKATSLNNTIEDVLSRIVI